MKEFYEIISWEKYQHYKHRNPPWIKLHKELLTSEAWVMGDSDSRTLMIACMLVAAETGNRIPADGKFICRRAFLNAPIDFSPLEDIGFIARCKHDASMMQATCKHDASNLHQNADPETETETEVETEKEKEFFSICDDHSTKRQDDSITFACLGTPAEWRLDEKLLSTLKTAYPLLDVKAEVKRAWAWCEANQAKRKTAKGMPKFINAWMARADEKPKQGRGPHNGIKMPINAADLEDIF